MAESEKQTPLGEFLRSRRAALKPDDAGVVSYGARRVPGLRREELAQLAGVSATYYTRLEQGHSVNASPAVIDALARALNLDADERAHLHELARPTPGKRRRPSRPATARPGARQLIDAMGGDVPAVVLGRRTEVLAWNDLGHLLLAGHCAADAPDRPADRPNLTRMLFLDAHHRDLYTRWQEEATRAVASLRVVAGRFQDDRDLAELIGELSMRSPEFASLWSKHPVATCASGTKYFRHPEVGELALQFEALHLPDDSGHRILMYSAAPGSPSEAALHLLRAKVTETSVPVRTR
ncbi:helix-turn-helix domain-containing protein [Actinomadura syzygii]|uniref:Helix-turn-helix transcriptional regulator n=1 Tax=Actinomadura syzygii TaxID=1427538 RepID=A0A5D0UKR4_9ACTN|nr:helix-turn-helix transcriptional regulator [Actinomadura syzygii]TYC18557.1 helix-turn-helix transcriptional regulator [Actinomadura syzygii]